MRRTKAALVCCGFLLAASTSAAAQQRLDLSKPDEALKASQKIQCSLVDGKPATFWWRGTVYSRVAGERDRALFNVEGMRLNSFDEMPDEVKNEVKQNWPVFLQAPPPDDARPSMTSWDQFKRWVETKKPVKNQ